MKKIDKLNWVLLGTAGCLLLANLALLAHQLLQLLW